MAKRQPDKINIDALFPPFFKPFLTQKARWKCVRGGRGSGKTTNIARGLLLLGQQSPVRILCVREIMQSLRESVHNVLQEQIVALGLHNFYTVERGIIYGPMVDTTNEHGMTVQRRTEFIFAGLRGNVQQIKSYNNIQYCWCEEAEAISGYSWRVLSPTIRNKGAEIWVSYNPEQEQSATHTMFNNPPADSVVVDAQYWDNPWFDDPLKSDMLEMKERDYEMYLHVWEGHCIKFYEGAVYLHEMKLAEEDGRITDVPYRPDHQSPQAFFDLGFYDFTAVVIAQVVGDFVHIIDYHQNRQKPLEYYMKWLEQQPYAVSKIWLPHDARQRTAAQPLSYEHLVREKGHRVQVLPQHLVADGINAVRTLFPRLRIDGDRCADLVECLRRYRYELEADIRGGFKSVPAHDQYSHGCDATRYCAMGLRATKEVRHVAGKYANLAPFRGHGDRWMSL